MKTKILALSMILFLSLSLTAQEDRIDAQRPTLAESYSIIKGNTIQVESGLQYDLTSGNLSANTFVRHSFLNLIELRVFKSLTSNDFAYSGKIQALDGENVLGLGASFIYTNDDNDEYKISLTKEFNRLSVTANTAWNDGVLGNRYSNLHFSYLLLPNWSGFIEGQVAGSKDTDYDKTLQGGLVFIPYDNVQFDTFVGYNEFTEFFGGVGISFRIDYGKKQEYIIEEID